MGNFTFLLLLALCDILVNSQDSFLRLAGLIGEMMKFYLTFGQQFPSKNGWVEIESESYEAARNLAFDIFGKHWSMLYEEEEFEKEYFPSGKIGETLK
jgi:hypothetical protein